MIHSIIIEVLVWVLRLYNAIPNNIKNPNMLASKREVKKTSIKKLPL